MRYWSKIANPAFDAFVGGSPSEYHHKGETRIIIIIIIIIDMFNAA